MATRFSHLVSGEWMFLGMMATQARCTIGCYAYD